MNLSECKNCLESNTIISTRVKGSEITYKQQVEVCMQEAVKSRGILSVKDARLQQVDQTQHVCIEQYVIASTKLHHAELCTTLKQCTQHRQLSATITDNYNV